MGRTKIAACIAVCFALFVIGCSKPRVLTVGSKNFTEQVILGEIVAQHLEHKLNQKVERKLNLGGTQVAHQAILAGEIDIYPEYTGTALATILKVSMFPDQQAMFEKVRDMYKMNYQLEWLNPLGFENTFAMVVLKSDADRLQLSTLSDVAKTDAQWALGVGYEFLSRPDGMAALNSSYQIGYKRAPMTMDLGLLYKAIQQKEVNMIAANSTDGLLSVLPLKVLADNKKAFPSYHASLVLRSQTAAEFPGVRATLDQLSGKISQDAMQRMNYEVDGKKIPPSQVATEFLRQAGLL